ncbi:MAG: phage integrase N-terminal SAM-like domain-containing protein [SAR324 cluster bacterium]|nr:phage integrase N-terminal SAM-like domain-containing protein [SAR324 cluster bacterium]
MSTHQANQTLLVEIRDLMKREHYSVNTERAYSDWIKQFVKFHCLQARESLFVEAENKVEKFLTYLATERDVSASTQNQAFNALVFYRIWKPP